MNRIAWFALLLTTPVLVAAAEPPFQTLARELVGADQGVYVQAEDGSVLASVAADRPVHPASVTKIATTLALLQRLGPAFRFETRLLATGPVRQGTLEGDLIVQAGTDPFLVSENAHVMLLELHREGIRSVEDDLRVEGTLLFNWSPDPEGRALRRALEGRTGGEAWAAVRAARADAPATGPREVALRFADHRAAREDGAPRLLVLHRSPPLIRVVKALNCYSNNVFHLVADRIGGAGVVERVVRDAVGPTLASEIVIENGAGAGTTNRLSPRAAVAILETLRTELERHGLTLVDVLPVSGVDPGTLRHRLPPGLVVGKTGTFGSQGASALAGVLRTARYGRVTFAVLNRGVPPPTAQRRQDAFVQALGDATGALRWSYDGRALPRFTEARIEIADPRP